MILNPGDERQNFWLGEGCARQRVVTEAGLSAEVWALRERRLEASVYVDVYLMRD